MRTELLSAALLCALLASCSGDDADSSSAGSGAGQSAGASSSGGSAGAGGSTQAGVGGASGTSGGTAGSASTGGTSAGTGGTSAGTGGTSGTSAGTGGTSAGAGGDPSDAGSEDPIDDGTCVVAERIDSCCPVYVPVTRTEAKADPCLVALGEPQPSGQERLDCQPEVCTDVLCTDPLPPSRLARRANGACQLVDECVMPSECVLASDMSRCCACPEWMPMSLVQQEPCIIDVGQSSVPAGCEASCLNVLCGACNEPSANEPTCALGDALGRCQ